MHEFAVLLRHLRRIDFLFRWRIGADPIRDPPNRPFVGALQHVLGSETDADKRQGELRIAVERIAAANFIAHIHITLPVLPHGSEIRKVTRAVVRDEVGIFIRAVDDIPLWQREIGLGFGTIIIGDVATASRIAASSEAGSAAGGLSHTRQATQTRGRFTSEGPRAMSRTAQMKIARQPGRRLRLFICGEALAQDESDEDRNPPIAI